MKKTLKTILNYVWNPGIPVSLGIIFLICTAIIIQSGLAMADIVKEPIITAIIGIGGWLIILLCFMFILILKVLMDIEHSLKKEDD